MPLPSPTVPTFECTIPSSGKKIKYRPFLVKEEKLLLFVMEQEPELPDQVGGVVWNDVPLDIKKPYLETYKKERDDWSTQVKDVVVKLLKDCIQSRIKVEDLASFDIEYLFLRIRAVSSGEDVNFKVTCKDDDETQVNVTLNLMDVEVKFPEEHNKKIMLSDTLGLTMKYPGIDQFVDITLLNNSLENTDELFSMIAGCVDQIFQGEEVWDAVDVKQSEIIGFIEAMTQKQFEQLQEFFNSMPSLYHDLKAINPKTGVESVYRLEGLQSFFG